MRQRQEKKNQSSGNGSGRVKLGGQLEKHHIVPESRGGKNGKNLKKVPGSMHDTYHRLFGECTPDEVISFLVHRFWGGQWDWVEKALRQKRIPPESAREICQHCFD